MCSVKQVKCLLHTIRHCQCQHPKDKDSTPSQSAMYYPPGIGQTWSLLGTSLETEISLRLLRTGGSLCRRERRNMLVESSCGTRDLYLLLMYGLHHRSGIDVLFYKKTVEANQIFRVFLAKVVHLFLHIELTFSRISASRLLELACSARSLNPSETRFPGIHRI